jgi:uncharacterized membrane protein YeaQ/YmgE (transglycosylase-associated protein family)
MVIVGSPVSIREGSEPFCRPERYPVKGFERRAGMPEDGPVAQARIFWTVPHFPRQPASSLARLSSEYGQVFRPELQIDDDFRGWDDMEILWTIIIGFVAGIIAKFIMPGDKEPSGFILTTILGIVGAFVATFIGQAVGWYGPNEGARFIGSIVGACVVLAIYGFIAGRTSSRSL